MNPLETYIRECFAIHSTAAGTPKTFHYGTLERRLYEIGNNLKFKFKFITNKNKHDQGASLPEVGFVILGQFQKFADNAFVFTQTLTSGMMEIQPTTYYTGVINK